MNDVMNLDTSGPTHLRAHFVINLRQQSLRTRKNIAPVGHLFGQYRFSGLMWAQVFFGGAVRDGHGAGLNVGFHLVSF
jgi:hypothetical protein